MNVKCKINPKIYRTINYVGQNPRKIKVRKILKDFREKKGKDLFGNIERKKISPHT